MQQVAGRNCLHGAASGARAGVSVLEELFWNAAARSVRGAASFALPPCICMQIARVLHRARDGLWYVVSGTRRDAALRTGLILSNPILGSETLYSARAAAEPRALLTKGSGCSRALQGCFASFLRGRLAPAVVLTSVSCFAPSSRGVFAAVDATGELPHIAAAAGARLPHPRATVLRRFVKNSYVRQVISEGAPRAPGAQYIWFGSFLPPLARHSS